MGILLGAKPTPGGTLNPQAVFCPNLACPARGQVGQGNLGVHQAAEQRYICHVCQSTFATTKGTLFYRLRTPPETVLLVIALLSYGCPLQAIVKAMGFDERTVKNWWRRAGAHCQGVHEHLIGQCQLDLQQVQADEIRVKTQGGVVWMAMALMVRTRLWLGGAISPARDHILIERLVAQVRAIALCRPLLVAVDGLSSYVSAFRQAFRTKVPRHGQRGRCRWHPWEELNIVQVVKAPLAAGGTICRRLAQGVPEQVESLLARSQGGGTINTAFIERFNATCRQRLCWLTRRTRCLAQQQQTLQAGMYIVGCLYNFCDPHRSLRVRLVLPNHAHRWLERTPACAAGLADHSWSFQELFTYQVPPPRWVPPTRRGRRSIQLQALVHRWAA
jgi:transposase-like protein